MKYLWVFPLFGSIAAALAILITFATGASAPQEAAGFALACALAIVPYVFVRAIEAMQGPSAKDCTDRIVDAVQRSLIP